MPTFSQVFPTLPLAALHRRAQDSGTASVDAVLAQGRARSLEEFAALLSPAAAERLPALASLAESTTRRHFGRVIRLFAPLYLSNECINVCKYCGFSRNNPIPRITLPPDKVEAEARRLATRGFRHILLVAGEHPKWVSNGYVGTCVRRLLPFAPSVALELGPLETEDYVPMVQAGADGLVVYQETYDREMYREMHTAGPKKNFDWRLDTPERGAAAGFRRLGIGALLGLHPWRAEALALAAHALHLGRHCWKTQLTISFPRLRPAAGGFQPREVQTDREFLQLLAALRLLLPHAGFVLSTREPARLRDAMVPYGITLMSAGSSTEPGGYEHFDENFLPTREQKGEQFHIADERPPEAIAAMLASKGFEPVWKDADQALVAEGVRPEVVSHA
jgi:2-iminoacetate synthase